MVMLVCTLCAQPASALHIDYEKSRNRLAVQMPEESDQTEAFLVGVMQAGESSVYDRVAAYEKVLELGGWLFDGAMVVNGDFAPSDPREQETFGVYPDVMAWFQESRSRYLAIQHFGMQVKPPADQLAALYSMTGSTTLRCLSDILLALHEKPDTAASYLASELQATQPLSESGVLRIHSLIIALSLIGNKQSVAALDGFLHSMPHVQLCQDALFGLSMIDLPEAAEVLRSVLVRPAQGDFQGIYPVALYALFAHGPQRAVPVYRDLQQTGADESVRHAAQRIFEGDLSDVLMGQVSMISATRHAYMKVWDGFGVIVKEDGYEVRWMGADVNNSNSGEN